MAIDSLQAAEPSTVTNVSSASETLPAINPLEKRFQRERLARKQAEKLLEDKSLALYESNQELLKLTHDLEQKVAERTQAFEQERNRALALSKAKSEFVATMSHEIRTPINGIIGALKLLETEPLSESCMNLIGIAHHSSELLLNVINDILDFSKIEAGQMQIEETPFNLAEKLRTVIHSFSELAAQKPLLLSLDIDPAIAPWIMGDSLRLHQVLNNFLSNAVKFTEHGQVSLSVHLEQTTAQHTAQQTLLFQVKDTGIGISQEGVQRLFQDFSQVDASTSRRFGGTGLGLAICKKMIELMGGQIGVNSQVDQGSCFWFRLPYRYAQAPTLDAPQPHKTQFTQAQAAHILLVDDNLINRQIGDKILQKLGHQVTLADSGFAALTACQQQDFDLILMDCQMPDMDGYETTQKLRQALYRQPIIALTANTSQEDQELAKLSGMNDFVSKPFNPDKLQQTIQAWLSHV